MRRLGELCTRSLDLDAILRVARSAPPLEVEPWEAPVTSVAQRPVVAVAGGPAFTFSYAETAELLTAAGADVAVVDPLRDEALPAGAAGLVLGGGFPEVFAEQLSANRGLRDDVARLAATGAPVAAECAGLLYLCERLDGLPMCGVLPAAATMTPRLALGYRTAEPASASWLGTTPVTGHEFHRTTVEPRAGAVPAWAVQDHAPEGWVQGGVHASYLHLHWAGVPGRRRPVRLGRAGRGMRRLVGVGVGPGDPELVTVKGVRVLVEADLVVVPVMDPLEQGRAEATVRAHVTHDRVRRLVFALDDRGGPTAERLSAWEAAADAVAEQLLERGGTVAFATIGDPNVYSTFTYLADAVRERVPDVEVETVPGITAMQDLAARSGTVLCEGTESLALLPLTAGVEAFEEALTHFDSVVAYKGGRHMPAVLDVLRRSDRLDGAVYGAALGLPDQQVGAAADAPASAPYLSTVIVPARRTTRGGKL